MEDNLCFVDKLIIWYLHFNVSKNALTGLLKIFPSELNLPLSASTLLKPLIKHNDAELRTDDSYYHFDFKELLVERIKFGLTDKFQSEGSIIKSLTQEAEVMNKKLITISINVDGLKLFNSARKCMWPIVCRVNQSVNPQMGVGWIPPQSKLRPRVAQTNQMLFLRNFMTFLGFYQSFCASSQK